MFKSIMEFIFCGLLSYYAYSINDNIKVMANSISELNAKMAVQQTKSSANDAVLNDHEIRLRSLEKVR